jgi:PST family polysaccharide transporter
MADDAATTADLNHDIADVRRKSLHGATATVGAQGAKFVLKFGITLMLARLLTPAEFGLVAMVSPILAFMATLNDLGFAQAIVQRREVNQVQLSSLFWINLLVSLGLAGVLVVGSPLVGALYHEHRTTQFLCAMAALLVLGALGVVPNALLSRRLKFISQIAIDLAGVACNGAVVICAALLGMSSWSIIIGQCVSSLLTVGLAFALAGWRPSRPQRLDGVGDMVRFGAHLTGANLATYVSMTADNMIVGAFVGKVALGLYDRSYNLVVPPINQLMAPVIRVALPLLVRANERPDLYRRTYITLLRTALILTTPVMISCIVLSSPLIVFLLGEKWAAAAPIFAWMCVGGIVSPMFSTTGWIFASCGRTDRQFSTAIATAALSVAAFAVGVHWGVKGVAVCSAISFIVFQTPLMLWVASRVGAIRLVDFGQALWPLAVAGVVAAVGLSLIAPFVHGWLTLPAIGAAYVLFGGTILVLPGGRDLVRQARSALQALRKPR